MPSHAARCKHGTWNMEHGTWGLDALYPAFPPPTVHSSSTRSPTPTILAVLDMGAIGMEL